MIQEQHKRKEALPQRMLKKTEILYILFINHLIVFTVHLNRSNSDVTDEIDVLAELHFQRVSVDIVDVAGNFAAAFLLLLKLGVYGARGAQLVGPVSEHLLVINAILLVQECQLCSLVVL
jgi:hypothetical protein